VSPGLNRPPEKLESEEDWTRLKLFYSLHVMDSILVVGSKSVSPRKMISPNARIPQLGDEAVSRMRFHRFQHSPKYRERRYMILSHSLSGSWPSHAKSSLQSASRKNQLSQTNSLPCSKSWSMLVHRCRNSYNSPFKICSHTFLSARAPGLSLCM
jgi:hypothetical protein